MSATERKVLSILAALVPVADAVFGWHLTWEQLAGIIVPIVGLVFSEAHVAAKREESKDTTTAK